MAVTTSVLLLSGAGLPPWIWDQVRQHLPVASAVAARATTPASVGDHARAALASAPQGDSLVLVAHSAGGVVAGEVTALAPGRVAAVLGVCAVVPAAGGSFTSSLPLPQRLLLPLVMRVAGTRPPESAVRRGLAAGLDEDTVERLLRDLTPEDRAYFTGRTQPGPPAPVRGYVTTADDAELPPALQQRYLARLAPTFRRELPGGHLPMLLHPRELAAAISEFVDGHVR